MKDDSPIHVLWLPTIAAAGIAYVVSWIDLIPDVPFFGWLDDVAVIIGLVWFFTSWLPRNSHRIYWFRPKRQSEDDAQQEDTKTRAEPGGEKDFDPFEVLNVRRGASEDEVRRAYRELLVKYHPDKVTHLGEEFQRMAHDKVIDIRRAYEMLCGRG